MATRFIARDLGAPDAVGVANGFAYNSSDVLEQRKVISGSQVTSFVPGDRVVAKTASFSVTAADHGTTFLFDDTTTIVASLPATVAGLRFRFAVKQLTTSGGHSVSPVAADFVTGNGLTATVDKDVVCSAATDRVGDFIEVTGVTGGWYITGVIGTWAKES